MSESTESSACPESHHAPANLPKTCAKCAQNLSAMCQNPLQVPNLSKVQPLGNIHKSSSQILQTPAGVNSQFKISNILIEKHN